MDYETSHLEENLGVPNNIEEPPPSRHLRLPRTTDHNFQRRIEMIQKLHHHRQNRVCLLTIRVYG